VSIVLDRVSFAYGSGTPVLSELSLAARPGEIVGLLGSNGAGKTTTFRLLAGLLRPDQGEVRVAGVSVAAEPREARRRSAYVPDEPLTYATLSALENIDLFGRLWGVPAEEARARGETLLRAVDLWPVRHQWVAAYSRGMRQKLALAVALLHRPQVLVMDEPFTGLDVAAALYARELMREQARAGGTVLFSSHVPELVEALGDRVAVLHRGRIAYDEPRATVLRDGGALAVLQSVWDGTPRVARAAGAFEVRSCSAG
jgi:ABC-2 type transport system ATP-binding protein